VFFYDPTAVEYLPSSWFGSALGWLPELNAPPGEGFFIQAAGTGTPLSITFVGEVPQGNLQNAIPAFPMLGLKSSIVPQSASLGEEGTAGTLEFPSEVGDIVLKWDVALQDYAPSSYFGAPLGWLPDAVVGVAEGFFVQKAEGTTKTTWTRNFSVNP
jgi:hypothetical protein